MLNPRWSDWHDYTARELINFARCYTSEVSQRGVKNCKYYSKRKNRAATRDAIQTESFDKIPQLESVKEDYLWGWD